MFIATFTLAGLALTGIPPLNGFVSKWYLLRAAADAGFPLAYAGAGALLISALLSAIYMLGNAVRAWFPARGRDLSALSGAREADWRMSATHVVLALGLIATGVFSQPSADAANAIARGLF